MTTNQPVRVLITDDSAFMRKIITDILSAHPGIEVAGTARNGSDAVRKAASLQPDVITMDVEMPVMDGLTALKEILSSRPVPVVMVSSLTREGAETTLQALASGAVDFICKPSGAISLDMAQVGEELTAKVLAASQARLPGNAANLSAGKGKEPVRGKTVNPAPGTFSLVVIATSTGGPRALQKVIPSLPADFPVPVAVVQHMPRGFTASLAQRLNQLSNLTVLEARHGMPLMRGMVVIAPGDQHLLLEDGEGHLHCTLSQAPPIHSVRPAADPLFESAARLGDKRSVGVILTGMGKDGTDGAVRLKERGGLLIAESAETAVVYGMPRAAEEAGLVDRLLPLHQIADELIGLFS